MKKRSTKGIKNEIRIIGIDDIPFIPKSKGSTKIFGVIIRGATIIEGVVQSSVEIDGSDGTEKVVEMVKNSSHYNQIRAIMLAGITVGGFNVLDIEKISKKTERPVIVVIDKKPDFESIRLALEKLPDGDRKWYIIEKLQDVKPVRTLPDSNPIYYQAAGVGFKDAERIIKLSTNVARLPEPVRIAHLIGRSFL